MKNTFIILTSLFLTSCIGVKTNSAYDPNARFDGYKTFGWIEMSGKNYKGPEYAFSKERRNTLVAVLQEVMESKGLVNNQEQPDLLIGFHSILEEKEVLLEKNNEMADPYNRQISYWDDYENYYNEKVHRFLKGTLVIDLIDAQTGAVVWQSIARRYMDQNPNVTKTEILKAVEKALRGFPPESE